MLLATPEQRRTRLDFTRAGPFGTLGRPKYNKERLEKECTLKAQRLKTAVEYKRSLVTTFRRDDTVRGFPPAEVMFKKNGTVSETVNARKSFGVSEFCTQNRLYAQ